jgi:hypothetical protein
MREYKFRAWDSISNQMIYPKYDILGLTISNGDILNRYGTSCGIVTQYTGYKDCKENDIYEGDVIKCWHGIIVVKFETFDDEQGYCIPLDDSDIEVIGNIFENPEFDNQIITKK